MSPQSEQNDVSNVAKTFKNCIKPPQNKRPSQRLYSSPSLLLLYELLCNKTIIFGGITYFMDNSDS